MLHDRQHCFCFEVLFMLFHVFFDASLFGAPQKRAGLQTEELEDGGGRVPIGLLLM